MSRWDLRKAIARALPQVGQWCEANTTSMSGPNMSRACCRYFDHKQAVANFRAAERIEIVQRVGRVLRRAERLELRQVEHELGRRLRLRRHQDMDVDPVERDDLAGLGGEVGRQDEADGSAGGRLAEAPVDLARRRSLGSRLPYM